MIIKNRVKKALKEGDIVSGLISFLPCTDIVEIMGQAGFDFVIFDQEHAPFTDEQLKHGIIAAEASAITPLVKVAENKPFTITRALDLGAQGVIVPHITSADDAVQAVQAARYPSEGSRSYCPFVRANRWGMQRIEGISTQQINEQILVILLIEEVCAFDNIESILTVPGIDAILPGPGDLSATLGVCGQFGHVLVQQKLEQATKAAKAKELAVGCHPLNNEDARRWKSLGAQIFYWDADVSVFSKGCKSIKQSAEQLGK